jgi:hypothetical protein
MRHADILGKSFFKAFWIDIVTALPAVRGGIGGVADFFFGDPRTRYGNPIHCNLLKAR